MEPSEVEFLSQFIEIFHVAIDRVLGNVPGEVGPPAAKLIVVEDAVTVIGEIGEGEEVVVGSPRTSVQQDDGSLRAGIADGLPIKSITVDDRGPVAISRGTMRHDRPQGGHLYVGPPEAAG